MGGDVLVAWDDDVTERVDEVRVGRLPADEQLARVEARPASKSRRASSRDRVHGRGGRPPVRFASK